MGRSLLPPGHSRSGQDHPDCPISALSGMGKPQRSLIFVDLNFSRVHGSGRHPCSSDSLWMWQRLPPLALCHRQGEPSVAGGMFSLAGESDKK